ncbi:MAG: DUF362 domain-containing protein [Theionarchaea archaeon]|nr:DUF362 domain-containing protein [Theionarchaea archaeon]MBU7000636.1 DUF362 domain-containing protein [Theionarchaea archaeon]MBU7021981.1 DUF362 domain-containing protein [Theionarchaea archaeon]MBU7035779.1 DUF362 domain-containing protein [Theionarchaea archaeon]MBU7041367.1 DUF362 domain-containing protein [Theionarchaea archaeon]
MVTVVQEKDKRKAFTEAVADLYIEKGSTVAIKPNLGIQKEEACTDFQFMTWLVDYIAEFSPGKIMIVESDTDMRRIWDTYDAFGYHSLDVELINTSETHCTTIYPENTTFFKSFAYPDILKESVLISFAKLKTHVLTVYTGAVKNQYGLIPFPDKRIFHKFLDRIIVDANSIFPCHYYLLDGFYAMEGQGPLEGNMVELDLVLAGKDPVAVDSCACRAVGIDPETISHLVLAEKKGIGTSACEVEGEIPASRQLRLPEQ